MLLRLLPVALVGLALTIPRSFGQEVAPADTDPALPSVESISEELQQLAADVELSDASKSSARESYARAQRMLGRIETLRATAQQFQSQIDRAPQDLESARQRWTAIQQHGAPTVVRPPANATLTLLEQELAVHEEALKTATERFAEQDHEPKRRAIRWKEIPAETEAARRELKTIETVLTTGVDADTEELESTEAHVAHLANLVRRQQLELKLRVLSQESAAYQATVDLLTVQRDVAAAELAEAETQARRWREIVMTRRQTEAEQQALAARQTAFRAAPAVKGLAESISRLAERRTYLAGQISKVSQRMEESQKVLSNLDTGFKTARDRINEFGLSDASGELLRNDRAAIPEIRTYRRAIRDRSQTLSDARFQEFEYNDRLLELAQLDEAVVAIAETMPTPVTAETRAEIRNLLTSQRQCLQGLVADHGKYMTSLLQANDVEGQIIRESLAYAHFIDERVLWIRNATPPQLRDAARAVNDLRWLASRRNWRSVTQDLRGHPLHALWIVLPFLLGWGILLYAQKPCRRLLTQLGEASQRKWAFQFMPTLRALGLTLVISALWPTLMVLLAWRLSASLSSSDFSRALATGLLGGAIGWFPLEFLRQVCRPTGLGVAHLDWPSATVAVVRGNLRWINLVGLPLLVVTIMLAHQAQKPFMPSSLGRMTFVLLLLLASVFLHRLLRSRNGVIPQILAFHPDRLVYRTRGAWVTALLAAPMALAGLSLAGYCDTATTLGLRLYASGCLWFFLILVNSLMARWILTRRRKLTMDQARQRRASESQDGRIATDPPGAAAIPERPEDLDIGSVSQQTQQLFRALCLLMGLLLTWVVWSDVIPALSILKQYPAWPGARALTVADLLMAALVMVTTYVATRNVAGLLELTLLNHLPVDRGARYATTSLCRYAVLTAGVVMTARSLGIRWASVQWLIAAMGIGLGFGLQEIFANFVSGIVLLFERPIRVGDVVTLSETTGVVTRIRLRSTTIKDWDRKEYIVPNKDLVTGRLLNWTLSDQTNRIVITAGVAFGTDTQRARDLMLSIAHTHPNILADPPPTATFERFGHSSLDLVLRCYLPDLDHRLETIHELHTSIDAAFRQAGIDIAFPQREILLRTVPESPSILGKGPARVASNGNGHGHSG